MSFKKTFAGVATFGALATGATFGADAQINPYEDKGNRFEIVASSTIEAAGENTVKLEKDRPAVTLEKWNGEAGLTVVYDKVKGEGSRAFLTDRMEWKDSNNTKEEVHAYPLDAGPGMEDGGFEIEVILNEKPDTNVWEFKIEGAEELDFFYQPELTPEEIAEGAERPENVIGSYAVYHKEKVNHVLGATNYGTGKAYHIYRPKAFDADGNEQWAELSYKDGALSVAVPQEWLEKATYPVRVDPTFGYTTQGASNRSATNDSIRGSIFSLSELADATSMSVYMAQTAGTAQNAQMAIYTKGHTTYNLQTVLIENTSSFSVTGSTPALYTASLDATTSLIVADYWLYSWVDNTDASTIRWYFDAGATNQGDSKDVASSPSFLWPYPLDFNGFATTDKFSIYVTYTSGADGPFRETFIKTGATAWIAPTDVTSADVACWGAGGGGGVIANNGGGGGGGGAFASSTVAVTPGTAYTVRVGAGGASDSATAAGDSSFGTTTVVADGGVGSTDLTAGTGGTTANSTGSVEFKGGDGGAGAATADAGGGGGGGAGPNGAGGNGAAGSNATGDGGGGGGGNGGANASGITAGSSTNGGAGGNGGNGAVGAAGSANARGGGGGGGGDNGFRGGASAAVGAGSGGGEVTGAGPGAAGQCTITYTVSAGGGGASSTPSQSIFWFD